MKEIKKYKGVSLKYSESDARIYFSFEGRELNTKYVFEAERIIDEPIWQECELFGYFVDGYSDKFIGLAKATRKNTKNGEPDWLFKGEYDLEFRRPNSYDRHKVYLSSVENTKVYERWQEQRTTYIRELRSLNNITTELV